MTAVSEPCLRCASPSVGSPGTQFLYAVGLAFLRAAHASRAASDRESHRRTHDLELLLATEQRDHERTRLLMNRAF